MLLQVIQRRITASILAFLSDSLRDEALLLVTLPSMKDRVSMVRQATKVPFAENHKTIIIIVTPHRKVVVYGSRNHSKNGKRQYKR